VVVNSTSQATDIGREKAYDNRLLETEEKTGCLADVGVSAVLAGLILAKTTSFFTTVARAESIVQKAAVQDNGDADWARKMSMDELREVRGDIAEYIEGLRARGVTDPEEYEDALRKMETVEDAMWEREDSK